MAPSAVVDGIPILVRMAALYADVRQCSMEMTVMEIPGPELHDAVV